RAQLRHRAAEQTGAPSESGSIAAAPGATANRDAQDPPTMSQPPAISLEQAAGERLEAARRAEAAAFAEAAARREEREIAEAHAAAQRQASRYADSEIRRTAAAAERSYTPLFGRTSDLAPDTEPSSRRLMPSLEEVRPNHSRRGGDLAPAEAATQSS